MSINNTRKVHISDCRQSMLGYIFQPIPGIKERSGKTWGAVGASFLHPLSPTTENELQVS